MTDKVTVIPLSEDALNRYRITHPDRDLRPLLRRLHRLSASRPSDDADENARKEYEREVELCKLELLKWKLGVERIMGSVGNLNRQREMYVRRAEETQNRTEQLKKTLEGEKLLLARRQRERDEQIKCDEVAALITARGKTRQELDEHIVSLQESLKDHQASHELYAQTVQTRIELFSEITRLVDQVRSTKLPIDPQTSIEEVTAAAAGGSGSTPTPSGDALGDATDEKMDVDDGIAAAAGPSSSSRLNASALPFQPNSAPGSTSAPATRSASPAPGLPAIPTAASGSGSGSNSNSNANTMKAPPVSHGLPSRPQRMTTTQLPTPATHRIPSRPSTLRSVTTPSSVTAAAGGTGGTGLEDGELGGEEEGEVSEGSRGGTKRSAASNSDSRSRSTRARR